MMNKIVYKTAGKIVQSSITQPQIVEIC